MLFWHIYAAPLIKTVIALQSVLQLYIFIVTDEAFVLNTFLFLRLKAPSSDVKHVTLVQQHRCRLCTQQWY